MSSPLPYPRFDPERHPPPWSIGGRAASEADAFLGELLLLAGEEASGRFGDPSPLRKKDGTPVTTADRAAQDVLIAGLLARFPGDGIQAEEDVERAGGPRTWIIDPIDGTAAYSEGLAHWGPCVAALEGGRASLGALWMPRIREYYYFEAGLGAFRNGAPLPRLRPLGAPGRLSVLYVPSRLHAGARVDWPGKLRCLGSVAAHLCLVAAGCASATLVPAGWRLWDTALGLALIEAVGGSAVLPDGRPLDPALHVGLPFAAGTPEALAWLSEPGRIALSRPDPRDRARS